MPAPTTLPTRLSTAAATHGLLRAYQPARRAAVVAPARIAAFRPSTVLALSQRRPPPAASKARVLPIPRSRWTKFPMPPILARRQASSYWERLRIFASQPDESGSGANLLHHLCPHVLPVDRLLDDDEEPFSAALFLPQLADGPFFGGVGTLGDVGAFVLDDKQAAVLQLRNEIRVELVRRGRQPERVGMAGNVADPELQTRQAVDGLRALELLAILGAVEGRHVVGTKEVLSRLPAATIPALVPIHP